MSASLLFQALRNVLIVASGDSYELSSLKKNQYSPPIATAATIIIVITLVFVLTPFFGAGSFEVSLDRSLET